MRAHKLPPPNALARGLRLNVSFTAGRGIGCRKAFTPRSVCESQNSSETQTNGSNLLSNSDAADMLPLFAIHVFASLRLQLTQARQKDERRKQNSKIEASKQ